MADIDRSKCAASVHGTINAYVKHKCRCEDARAKKRANNQRWEARRKAGIDTTLVDATATHRRIRALMAAGHNGEELSVRYGGGDRHALHVLLEHRRVTRTTEERVKALYGALEAVPGASWRNRARGIREGWAVPFAWDPETIADPEATPDAGKPRAKQWRAKEMMFEYQLIRDSGMSHEYALKELGVSHEAWHKANKAVGA